MKRARDEAQLMVDEAVAKRARRSSTATIESLVAEMKMEVIYALPVPDVWHLIQTNEALHAPEFIALVFRDMCRRDYRSPLTGVQYRMVGEYQKQFDHFCDQRGAAEYGGDGESPDVRNARLRLRAEFGAQYWPRVYTLCSMAIRLLLMILTKCYTVELHSFDEIVRETVPPMREKKRSPTPVQWLDGETAWDPSHRPYNYEIAPAYPPGAMPEQETQLGVLYHNNWLMLAADSPRRHLYAAGADALAGVHWMSATCAVPHYRLDEEEPRDSAMRFLLVNGNGNMHTDSVILSHAVQARDIDLRLTSYPGPSSEDDDATYELRIEYNANGRCSCAGIEFMDAALYSDWRVDYVWDEPHQRYMRRVEMCVRAALFVRAIDFDATLRVISLMGRFPRHRRFGEGVGSGFDVLRLRTRDRPWYVSNESPNTQRLETMWDIYGDIVVRRRDLPEESDDWPDVNALRVALLPAFPPAPLEQVIVKWILLDKWRRERHQHIVFKDSA